MTGTMMTVREHMREEEAPKGHVEISVVTVAEWLSKSETMPDAACLQHGSVLRAREWRE